MQYLTNPIITIEMKAIEMKALVLYDNNPGDYFFNTFHATGLAVVVVFTLYSNMANRRMGQDWVYDELLNYVASPLFQAPVITFMETNCLSKF